METPKPQVQIILPSECLKYGDTIAVVADDLEDALNAASEIRHAVSRLIDFDMVIGVPFNNQMLVLREGQTAADVVMDFMQRQMMEQQTKHKDELDALAPKDTEATDGVFEGGKGVVEPDQDPDA